MSGQEGQPQLERVRVTQADLARMLGVTRQSVNELVKRGILVLGGDMRIDLDAARAACAQHLRPDAKSAQAVSGDDAPTAPDAPSEGGAAAGFQAARARRELAEAEIAERKLAQMSGELLPREAAVLAVFEIGRQVRDALEVMRRRVSPLLAASSSVADCDELLRVEHQALLKNLAAALTKAVPASEVSE